MLLYAYIPIICFNCYFTLLPSVRIKKHLFRIAVLIGLVLYVCLNPILYFLYIAGSFHWTLFLWLLDFSFIKNLKIIYRIALGILIALPTPITALYLFGLIFYGDAFDYHAFYPFIIYFFLVFWMLIKSSQWAKNYLKILAVSCCILPLTLILINWAYHNNPTTFLHSETVTIKGKSQTFTNTAILTLLKKVEQLIVLDINNNFEGIKSVTFRSIYKEESIEGKNQFAAIILVNNTYEITYYFNLSYDEEDYEPSFIESISYPSNFHLQSKKEDLNKDWTLEDLEKSYYQKQIKRIKIDYYLKNDIYKED